MSKHGPKVTMLITKFIPRVAVPDGGGITDGMRFFLDEGYRKQVLVEAEKMALAAIELIKIAPDNPFGLDDEAIADFLLGKIEEKLHIRWSK